MMGTEGGRVSDLDSENCSVGSRMNCLLSISLSVDHSGHATLQTTAIILLHSAVHNLVMETSRGLLFSGCSAVVCVTEKAKEL